MKKILDLLLYIPKVIVIVILTSKEGECSGNIHRTEAYVFAYVFSFFIWIYLFTLGIPYAALKVLTKNITLKDEEESLDQLDYNLILREGLSEFEWRNMDQVLATLEKKKTQPKGFADMSTSDKECSILWNLLIESRTGIYCEARLETKEEYLSGTEGILRDYLGKHFDNIESKYQEDEMEQILMGRRLMFRKKNFGGKKSPPPPQLSRLVLGFQ